MAKKSRLDVADDESINTGIYRNPPVRWEDDEFRGQWLDRERRERAASLQQRVDWLNDRLNQFVLPHVASECSEDELHDAELMIEGTRKFVLFPAYLKVLGPGEGNRLAARSALESLSEQEQKAAWQAIEALRGLHFLDLVRTELLLAPRQIPGTKRSDAIDYLMKSMGRVAWYMQEVGECLEAIRARDYEPLVMSGRRLRHSTALGGKASAKWTREVEVTARTVFEAQHQPGVSIDAAATRTAAVLKRDHKIDISATTIKRRLGLFNTER